LWVARNRLHESRAYDVPQTVEVRSGTLTLRALLCHPPDKGPFPAILLNHGSGRSREELERLGPYEQQANILGPVFARHGYVFLYLFRRGVGLSANQGINAVDVMNSEFAAHGRDARNTLQLRLLENEEMSDALPDLRSCERRPKLMLLVLRRSDTLSEARSRCYWLSAKQTSGRL